jgi:outer membrane protein
MLLPVLLLAAGSAFAEMKIAVLNAQRAIFECSEGKAMIAKIQSDLAADDTALKSLGASIAQLNEKLSKDGEIMSDPEKRKLQKEIEDKQVEYQFQGNKLQKTANDRQQEILQQIGPKAKAILDEIVTKEQYDLILQPAAAVYVNSKYDLTPQLIEKLNQKK